MTASQNFDYRREADTFVSVMGELAPGLTLDFTPGSLQELEDFVSKNFDPPGTKFVGDSLVVGMGCYVGEVIVRTLGGCWNREGRPEINSVGLIQAIFPIQKVAKRFRNGPTDSLVHYYRTVEKYAQGGNPGHRNR